MLKRLAAVVLTAFVGACSNPWQGFAPSYEEVVGAGWIGPEVAVTPAPIYCYATLAEPECFRSPQPGEENRLVGYFGPPPY
jgi:hypothetical protein